MALPLLRTRPERVAAAVVLSGFVTDESQPADDALVASRPPVFWGRGDADPLIWPEAIERLASWLPEHATPTVRVYPGVGHGVSDQELDDVRACLAEHL
jgi:phospholipase/carboxylesterase